eukprot:TRINITY_DN25971_c0_g1_i1.p1 TRINITY_DN25971_c0_g1~~TRINITY_DN25971_c0_g1_i1.p1  ORF type:complete len:458 (+),score=84.20 TRINITY_DN25971_c0_g1_i1:40-1413(+)
MSAGAPAAAAALRALARNHAAAAATCARSGLTSLRAERGATVVGGESGYYARLLGNAKGVAELWSGDHAAARSTLQEAYEEAAGGVPNDAFLDVGGLLNDVAVARFTSEGGLEVGATLEAEKQLKRALFLSERAHKPDGDLVATTLSNLGELQFWSGNMTRAMEYHTRAADMSTKSSSSDAQGGSPEVEDTTILQNARSRLCESAAGRVFVLAGHGEEQRRGLKLVTGALAQARVANASERDSCALRLGLSGILRDSALVNLLQDSSTAAGAPADAAQDALGIAIGCASTSSDSSLDESADLNKLIVRLRGEGPGAVMSNPAVLAGCWTTAACLPASEASSFLRALGVEESTHAELAHLRELLLASERVSEADSVNVRSEFKLHNSLALSMVLARCDGASDFERLRSTFVNLLIKESNLARSCGAVGVGLRDWNPRALQWKQMEQHQGQRPGRGVAQ